MTPVLKEDTGFHDKYYRDADTPNQTKGKGALISSNSSDLRRRVSMFILLERTLQNKKKQHSSQHGDFHSK